MTTKPPTKEDFLEALRQKGINNLDDLVDAIMPETGGYVHDQDDGIYFFEFDMPSDRKWKLTYTIPGMV